MTIFVNSLIKLKQQGESLFLTLFLLMCMAFRRLKSFSFFLINIVEKWSRKFHETSVKTLKEASIYYVNDLGASVEFGTLHKEEKPVKNFGGGGQNR